MKKSLLILSLFSTLLVQVGCESHRDEDIQRQEQASEDAAFPYTTVPQGHSLESQR